MPPHTTIADQPVLARETNGHYEAAPADPPVQLPPALAELLDLADDTDRRIARMLRVLITLQATGQIEAETGLTPEAWLSQRGRMLRVDRTFLTVAADVLTSMPATLACFSDGTLSWSQVRAIVGSVRGLRAAQRAAMDDEIAAAAHEFTTWDPEQIVWRVDLLAAELLDGPDTDDVDELLEEPDRPADTLVLQPRIDGTGGKLWGDYWDPVAFGTIENALSEQMGRPDALEPSLDDESRRRNGDRIGHARADALVDICRDSLAGTSADDPDGANDDADPDGPTTPPTKPKPSKPAKPLVHATVSLETLLGLSHLPGDLLTRMTGGRLRVDAAAARRLVDEGGAALRTIVIDEFGNAVGVGNKSYVPPGWLRETMLALQHECGTPGCRTAARSCDLDHVVPWPHGPTDVNNLNFACRRHHGDKTDGHWQVQVLPDGTRRHRHIRSGLTTDVPLTSFAWTSPKATSLRSGDVPAGTRPLAAEPFQPPRRP